MRIAICDDITSDCNIIHDTIITHPIIQNSKIDIFHSSSSLADAVNQDAKYDIAFLDVDMPELSGIELGKLIKNQSPKTFIVFVTSYPQYAIDAFSCEASDYLLKPLNHDKAMFSLNRLITKYQENNKYYVIKIKTEAIRIPIKDIYYIECCNKHIIYHTKNQRYETLGKLSTTYNALRDYGFYQIHQGYIVNMDKIARFEQNSVILDDGRSVMVSVRKRAEVLLAYGQYLEVHT